MTATNSGGGVRCPPILSREEIARRRNADEQRRLVPTAAEIEAAKRLLDSMEPETPGPYQVIAMTDEQKRIFRRERKGRR